MTTYLIFTRESVQDQGELDRYLEQALPTLDGHPAQVLAAYGAEQCLEGEPSQGVVLVAFPSKKEALAWYQSPRYQEVAQHRFKGARYRALMVEGL
ncbi:DUF1330 domain-containing protein [Aeromonas dhakensis]|uniref:DUF1330 domain-containing protein n=1 Tax=Aeromonas dhakensis TaxID=196024 RepID=UPI00197FB174|nr:DUF1330 domain-containing protein [Aeromonas dhakensis]MBW3731336.1 DUF1330 domain-containing protein [Aeromonas dhakensis]QSR55963.1 DUF1330 domain-containing protein [Aeromonas dhakensis]